LYSFTGGSDGAFTRSGLVQGEDGYFYGTTAEGGANSFGTVFKIRNYSLTTLYTFTGGTDGGQPYGGLAQGSDGYFYGTTELGGIGYSDNGYGTVFRITTNGALTTLHSFTGDTWYGGIYEGSNPYAGLVQGSDGQFYGTTPFGGTSLAEGGFASYDDEGTVFRLTIVPELQAAIRASNGLNLTWSTEAGGAYQLQGNSDLSSTNWTNLGSPVTATGATLSTTDIMMNGPQCFYRLVVSP